MEIFFVYAIKSIHRNYIYEGLSDNPERHFEQHKKDFNKTAFLLLERIYLEMVGSKEKARKREKSLKSGSGKEFLKSLI